jgi:glucose/arabinose dehydrogenase
MFGPDGMLYAAIGDGESKEAAQDRHDVRGKILRMTPWGSRAPGDPFEHSRAWSFGHRNSFGFTFDPLTDRLWETENGPACNDELNRIVKAGNYAWGPHEDDDCIPAMPGARETNRDGPTPRRLPELWWTPTIAPTGIAFCHGCGLGADSEGKAFVADYNKRAIRRVALTANRLHVASQRVVYSAALAITSVEAGPNGAIYFSLPHAIYRLVHP